MSWGRIICYITLTIILYIILNWQFLRYFLLKKVYKRVTYCTVMSLLYTVFFDCDILSVADSRGRGPPIGLWSRLRQAVCHRRGRVFCYLNRYNFRPLFVWKWTNERKAFSALGGFALALTLIRGCAPGPALGSAPCRPPSRYKGSRSARSPWSPIFGKSGSAAVL